MAAGEAMSRLAGRAALTTALAALALSACDSGRDTDGGGAQQPALTVPGQPPDLVTDVAAGALTEEQAEAILAACEGGVGVPGTSNECTRIIERLDPLPPCGLGICMYWGRLVDDENAGFLQVDQQESGSSVCADESIALCDGVTVPVAVVEPLLLEVTTASPTPTSPSIGTGTSSAPTETTSIEPTSSEPTSEAPTTGEPTGESVEPTATPPTSASAPPP